MFQSKKFVRIVCVLLAALMAGGALTALLSLFGGL